MSATIHTVSAKAFKALPSDEQAGFLASVASEFLVKTGRGRNIKTEVAMPTSYAVLYARRVRQMAKAAGASEEFAHKVVVEAAKQVAAG